MGTMIQRLWTGIGLAILVELIDDLATFPDEMLTVRAWRKLRHQPAPEQP